MAPALQCKFSSRSTGLLCLSIEEAKRPTLCTSLLKKPVIHRARLDIRGPAISGLIRIDPHCGSICRWGGAESEHCPGPGLSPEAAVCSGVSKLLDTWKDKLTAKDTPSVRLPQWWTLMFYWFKGWMNCAVSSYSSLLVIPNWQSAGQTLWKTEMGWISWKCGESISHADSGLMLLF